MPSLNFGDAWPWLQWVLAVAAVLAVVGAAIRVIPSVWRFVTRTVNTVNALADLPEDLEQQKKFRETTAATLAAQNVKIAQIHHEVNYNNGSSVKDAVGRVEQGVAGLYGKVTQLEEAHKQISLDIENKPPRNPRPRKPRITGEPK